MSSALVVVGMVVKPHGLAGEFSIVSHMDSPDFFAHVPRLYLSAPPRERPFRVHVQSWRVHNSRVLLKLEQFAGRDAVERLRGAELLVREEDLPPRAEGEILQRELIGLEVFLPDGARIGRIQAVSDASGQEVWSIRTDDGREALFPAHDDVILEIDLARNTVRIDPPPGLLELYLS